jgi:hypothetical protein
MELAISSFVGKGWGFIGCLSGAALLPPDAEVDLGEVFALHIAQGMQACAIVLADTDYPAVVRSQFERLYKHVGVTHDFFDTEVEALSWINKRGYL